MGSILMCQMSPMGFSRQSELARLFSSARSPVRNDSANHIYGLPTHNQVTTVTR